MVVTPQGLVRAAAAVKYTHREDTLYCVLTALQLLTDDEESDVLREDE